MSDDTLRSVQLTRTSRGVYEVTNTRGTTMTISTGDTDLFTPVELLLAAIAGCSSVDVDFITSRRAEPERFDVRIRGTKAKGGPEGNRLEDVVLTFDVAFPDGAEGDEARTALPRAVRQSHDRLCTVSRTIELPTPITVEFDGDTAPD